MSDAILRLPEELRSLILSYCNSSQILNLCLTSKSTYSACISFLFHAVDLSTHNESQWYCRDRTYSIVKVPSDHCSRRYSNQDIFVRQRQSKLITLLLGDPNFTRQTRILRWTLVPLSPNAIMPGPATATAPATANYNTDELWTFFSLFTKVTEIDLAVMMAWREPHAPTPLFNAVTSISLAGVMSYDLLASIFNSIDASKLRHLKLNNLQTYAEGVDVLKHLPLNNVRLHRRDQSGPIHGWLSILTGKCTSLRSFHFSTVAEFFDGPLHGNRFPRIAAKWRRKVTEEHRRYAELGAFIASVKPTLCEFFFEHGLRLMNYSGSVFGVHPTRTLPAGSTHDSPLPMDVFFDQHLLPVIASGGWLSLRKITVMGIGHWKPIDPWRQEATLDEIRYLHSKTRAFHDRAAMIWEAVGAGDRRVEFRVEDTASKPFFDLLKDSFTGTAR